MTKELEKALARGDCSLQTIKEQTREMCLIAVRKDGRELEYVIEQSEEICLEAVKENCRALEYVKEQTEEICIEAVMSSPYALRYVKEATETVKHAAWYGERNDLRDGYRFFPLISS